MQNDIFNTLSSLPYIYLGNKITILNIAVFILFIAILIMLIKVSNEDTEELVGDLFRQIGIQYIQAIKDIGIAMIVGAVLYGFGFELDFKIRYFPFILYSIVITAIIGVTIFEMVKFHQTKYEVYLNAISWIRNSIVMLVFILSVSRHLEWIELIVILMLVLVIILGTQVLSCVKGEKNNILSNKVINHRRDRAIDECEDLFPTRQRQLENFCKEINDMDEQPFAIMLSAKWGFGKTSFINAFKKVRQDQYEFVDIPAGFECNIVGMLNDIEKQLQYIFMKNNMFINQSQIINKYFCSMVEILSEVNNSTSNILKKYLKQEKLSYFENKEQLNQLMKQFYSKCNKKVIFIVDDLDRCNTEVKEKMFEVIRECVKFNNCYTIFLVDEQEIKTELLTTAYLEKYIYKKISLVEVSFEEIINFYKKEFLSEQYFEDKCDRIQEGGRRLKENIIGMKDNILSQLNEKYNEMSNGTNNTKFNQEKVDLMKRDIEALNRRLINPRSVKRFLNNIEDDLAIVNNNWFTIEDFDKNEYSKCNWVGYIFQVEFIKIFLPKEYDKIINKKIEYKSKHEEVIINIIMPHLMAVGNNGRRVLELILYHLYDIDSRVYKGEIQRLRDELEQNNLQQENISKYITHIIGMNPEYIERVIDYISKTENVSYHIIRSWIDRLIEQLKLGVKIEHQGLIRIIKKGKCEIWDKYSRKLYNNKQINSIRENIESSYIHKNMNFFKLVLKVMVKDQNKINNQFNDSIYSISLLHKALESLDLISDYSIRNTGCEIKEIRKFFSHIRDEYSKPKYKDIRRFTNDILDRIDNDLEVLENLVVSNDIAKEEKEYFSVETGVLFNNKLQTINDLIETLDSLEKVIKDRSDNKQKYILPILLDLINIIEYRIREDKNWFQGKIGRVIGRLNRMYELLESQIDDNSKLAWVNYRITLFSIKEQWKHIIYESLKGRKLNYNRNRLSGLKIKAARYS